MTDQQVKSDLCYWHPVYCFCARVFPDCEPATSEMQDQNSLWVPLCERCMQIAFAAGVRVRKLQTTRKAA